MRKFVMVCAAIGGLALTALWSSPAHAQDVITDPVTGITIDLSGGGGTGGGAGGGGPGGGGPGVRYADQIKFHVHWSTVVDESGQTRYRDTEYWRIDYYDENGQVVNYEYRAFTGPVVRIGNSLYDSMGFVWTVDDEDVETGDRWRW